MKYLMLVCEGLADEPVQELGGRTPLEAAKTPFMAGLAKKGAVGYASWAPNALRPTNDVACLSLLGYNPLEYYTGIAPLEALSFDVPQNDQELVFRCDLVAMLDEALVDGTAGNISPREASFLIEALNKKLAKPGLRFHAGQGHKNFLVVSGPEAEALDELECVAPSDFLGQRHSKYLPQGKGAKTLTDLMAEASALLENHEINRVRIDLGENPANRVWFWGQGKRPKLPAFNQKYGKKGALVSEAAYAKGLGKALGLDTAAELIAALPDKEFVFIHKGDGGVPPTLKNKIKRIEEFDALLGHVLKAVKTADCRVFVGAACAESLAKKTTVYGHTPFIVQGKGMATDEAQAFNEKTAAQSKLLFDDGHKLIEFFLKP